MVHIVLLIQFPRSRTFWTDFNCIHDCCEHICYLYEQRLRLENPNVSEMTYDIGDLYSYVDSVSWSESNINWQFVSYKLWLIQRVKLLRPFKQRNFFTRISVTENSWSKVGQEFSVTLFVRKRSSDDLSFKNCDSYRGSKLRPFKKTLDISFLSI